MKSIAVLAALTTNLALTYAQTHIQYELHRCEGRDQFTYWTIPPCAPGDKAFAISQEDPRKSLAEQIRRAECKFQAATKSPKTAPGQARPERSTAHCD